MPQTRRQRGGVRSKSLLKRGPSSFHKYLRRAGETVRLKRRAATPTPLTQFQQNYVSAIATYSAPKAAGKIKDPFKVLNQIKDLLVLCYNEYRKPRASLRKALAQAFETILEELPDLFEQVHRAVQSTGAPIDAPFLSVLDALAAKYGDDLLAKGYGHSPESIQQVINMIDHFIVGSQRSTAGLPMMNRFVATAKPSEFAKELSALIVRALTRGAIRENILSTSKVVKRHAVVAATDPEANALAALLGGLTVTDKPSQEQIADVFGAKVAEEMPEEEGWGGENNGRENF